MKTLEEIQDWLREKIAVEIKTKPESIALDVPFANYSLDSIVIVTLAGELEEWLNVSLDPTIFWEYPTIEILSDWLVKKDFSN